MESIVRLVNNTGSDIRPYEALNSLKEKGKLPEELADLFTVKVSPEVNSDGSPRYILEAY